MGPGETTGIVIITVAIVQGLLKLIEHLINKYSNVTEKDEHDRLFIELSKIKSKCGLSKEEAEQLKDLHDLHDHKDVDGIPLWYVPRSWAETQKEMIERLQQMQQTDFKMLSIIERLERRLENFDNRKLGD